MILGGVNIPYEKGLDGHSDADVLIHAIIDALLGAAALGDIGKLYPDTDNRYLGIDSRILLSDTADRLSEKGYTIVNIDATVVAQKPKLAAYIQALRTNIATTLRVNEDAINVKATPEEKLGFTGSGDGIAAHAVCLIQKA